MATLKTIILLWPFDLATTLWLAFFVYQCVVLAVKSKWKQLGQYAYDEAFKFFLFNLEKNTKLQAVVAGLRQKLPPVLRPFVSDQRLAELVNTVYREKVKPDAARAGLNRVPKLDVDPNIATGLWPALDGLHKSAAPFMPPDLSQQIHGGLNLAQQSALAAQQASQADSPAIRAGLDGSEPVKAGKSNAKTGLFGF